MTIVYPSGEAPPHAMYHVRKGDLPMVSLVSPNHQIILWLMGGLSMADPMAPESVQVTSVSGLMAPWEFIDQQGATQDGVSFVDALYGPTDINVDVLLTARDAKHLRQLRRHLQDHGQRRVLSALRLQTLPNFNLMEEILMSWLTVRVLRTTILMVYEAR